MSDEEDGAKRNKRKGKAKGTGRATKKSKSGLTEDELKERRKKHNEVEIRRRKRIKASFDELGNIVGCDSKQKRIILSSAIDMITEYEEKIAKLQDSIKSIENDDGGSDNQLIAPNTSGDSLDAQQLMQDVMSLASGDDAMVDHGSIFHSSGVPLHIASFDGRVLDCNEAFGKLFGFTREQLLNAETATTIFSLTSPDSLSSMFSTLGALMNGRPSIQTSVVIIGPQGTPRRVKMTAWSVRENGKPKYFMGMMLAYPTNDQGRTAPPSLPLQFLTSAPPPSDDKNGSGDTKLPTL